MIRAALTSCLVLSLSACPEDTEPGDECGEPDYAGHATDEVWRVIVDAYDQAEVGAADAVTITSPSPDEVFPAIGDAPAFAWTSPIARADLPRRWPLPSPSLLSLAFDLAIGEAHAHLPPITDDIYYLELTIPGRDCPVTALTTNEQYTLDAELWDIVKGATGPVTLRITSAYVTENRITEGPFRPSADVTFGVE